MQRTHLLSAAFLSAAMSLAAVLSAQAQDTPDPAQGAPAAPPATSGDAQASSGLKAGMVVKDSAGATVGKITQVGQTSDGTAAAALDVDGKRVVVPASTLTVAEAGDQAVSSLTKAQIKAAAAAKPG
jgi:hypothetical protein